MMCRTRCISLALLLAGLLLTLPDRSSLAWASLVLEDFKNASGFDRSWTGAVVETGAGAALFQSNREVARLVTDATSIYVQTADPISVDLARYPTLQLWVPNLEFGERFTISAFLDTESYATEHLLHDQYTAVPGQQPAPASLDLASHLVQTGVHNIKLRLRLIHEPAHGDPPYGARASVDWLKLVEEPAATVLAAPAPLTPAQDAVSSSSRVTLRWNPPAGYTGNTYSLILSQDPAFSDPTTLSVLDGVTGTSYETAPLAEGRWYWAVSATAPGGFSGPWSFHPATGDARDPQQRQPWSFVISRDAEYSRELRDRTGPIWFRNPGDTFREQEQVALGREIGTRSIKTFIRTLSPGQMRAMFARPDNVAMFDAFDTVCVNVLTDYMFTDWDAKKTYSPAMRKDVRDDWYVITDFLIKRYRGRGKTFLLSHVFEINHFIGPMSARPDFPVNDFIDDGQAGMRQALADNGNPAGIQIHDVVEVALARAGSHDYIQQVLSAQDADLFSISFYLYDIYDYAPMGQDAFGPWDSFAKTITSELDFMAANTPASKAFGVKHVMVGELGNALYLTGGIHNSWQGSRSSVWHLRLGAEDKPVDHRLEADQWITLTDGASYTLSGWAQGRMLDSGVALVAEVYGADNQKITEYASVPVSGTTAGGGTIYAPLSASFNAPAGSAKARLVIRLTGNGQAGVDDVSLLENGGTQKVINGGFETIDPQTLSDPAGWNWDLSEARLEQRHYSGKLIEAALGWGAPYAFNFELVSTERDALVAGQFGLVGPKPLAERNNLWAMFYQAAHHPDASAVPWRADGDDDHGWAANNGVLTADGHTLRFESKPGGATFRSELFTMDPAGENAGARALQLDVIQGAARIALEDAQGTTYSLGLASAPATGPLTLDFRSAAPSLPAGARAYRVRLEVGSGLFEADWLKVVGGPLPAAAPAPTLLVPADGQHFVDPSPRLTWQPPPGLTPSAYTLKLCQDPLFRGPSLITYRDGQGAAEWTMPAALAEGRWYWTVSATRLGGVSGLFTPARSFEVHAPGWSEDFTNPTTFNTYSSPIRLSGDGSVDFVTSGTIGIISTKPGATRTVGMIQTQGNLWLDVDQYPTMQIMVPSLEFGERLLVSVCDQAGGPEYLLHDSWTQIPGQGPRPQTFDLKGKTGFSGLKNLIFRLTLSDEVYGDPPAGAAVAIDWLKAIHAPASRTLAAPQVAAPLARQTVRNPVTLRWVRPAGFQGNLYTVTLSRHPQLADASTMTLRDQVVGEAFTLPPLEPGLWYWTVSATDDDGFSGAFLEDVVSGDVRDPLSHHFFSFMVDDDSSARQWGLYE